MFYPKGQHEFATGAETPVQLDQDWQELYDDLRRIAGRQMSKERPGNLLQTTAIVHEAYVRLAKERKQKWQSRHRFCAAAAVVMRRVLIDHARSEKAAKRGGQLARTSWQHARHSRDFER